MDAPGMLQVRDSPGPAPLENWRFVLVVAQSDVVNSIFPEGGPGL
jgi:hypothetical protein